MSDDDSWYSNLFVDVTDLPDDAYGLVQIVFLTAVYGYVIYLGTWLISEGSQLLIFIPQCGGLIGSVLLPLISALPESIFVMFSGFGSNAQDQLEVGMGVLAGSTVMTLTLAWSAAIYVGRVNVRTSPTGDPVCEYMSLPKLTPPDNRSLMGTGVSIHPSLRRTSILMVVTAVSYVIIQIPGLVYSSEDDALIATNERPFDYATMCYCLIGLATYLYFSIQNSSSNFISESTDEVYLGAIDAGQCTLFEVVLAMQEEMAPNSPFARASYGSLGVLSGGTTGEEGDGRRSEESNPLLANSLKDRVVAIVARFCKKFRSASSSASAFRSNPPLSSEELSAGEWRQCLRLMGEKLTDGEIQELLPIAGSRDNTEAGRFSVETVADCTWEHCQRHRDDLLTAEVRRKIDGLHGDQNKLLMSIPKDLIDLPSQDQQFYLQLYSIGMIGFGVLLLFTFTSPIIDCFSELADRAGISSFYISFVLAPFVGSVELFTSLRNASWKTSATATIALSTLMGSAVMDNTLVMFVMMAVIVSQGLYFEYFAECMGILVVEVALVVFVWKGSVATLADALVVVSLYPISLVLVTLLFIYYTNGG